ncbi:hypothetical protein B0H12DRAFT_988618, partial [Mycena haematopus]
YSSSDFLPLRGCINDAQNFAKGLAQILGPPTSPAFVLKDKFATRDKILSSFKENLINNRDIQSGDLIVIFFAGHGGRAKYPQAGLVEILCPVDESLEDPAGNLIPGIPDFTINALCQVRC